MDNSTFFNRCKELSGDASRRRWTAHDLAGFFQYFRPDGKALEGLFHDIPAGVDVYKRLQKIYRATAAASQGPQGIDAYFTIRNPEPAPIGDLARYATAQLTNWRQMAAQINQQELVDLLTPIPEIKIVAGSPPVLDPSDTESLDVFIYDVQTNWHITLEPLCSHSVWMREAFYTMACDSYLARYVTWPWYQSSSSIKDPFQRYFHLWLHGAELRCPSPDEITLFVRSTEGIA
jgi:hypothetical protein